MKEMTDLVDIVALLGAILRQVQWYLYLKIQTLTVTVTIAECDSL